MIYCECSLKLSTFSHIFRSMKCIVQLLFGRGGGGENVFVCDLFAGAVRVRWQHRRPGMPDTGSHPHGPKLERQRQKKRQRQYLNSNISLPIPFYQYLNINIYQYLECKIQVCVHRVCRCYK